MHDTLGRRLAFSLALATLLGQAAGAPTTARAADLGSTFVTGAAPVAPDAGRFTIIEENDALQPDGTDRHYTQGALFTYLSPLVAPGDKASLAYDAIGGSVPILRDGPGVKRKFDIVLGQSIFTPTVFRTFPLNPKDRPFAGWLYTGGSLLQETNGTMLENFEALIGVVGPDSLADVTQQGFHDVIGFANKQLGQTWKTQIKNEPGLALTYERKWKIWQSSLFGFETEAIPEVGITAGNVLTYGEGGVMVRIGRDLGVDYGIPRVRPSLSGTSWFDESRATDPWGWYLFGGLQGRAVARNIFLDGNTYLTSRSVDKEVFVGDVSIGTSVFYKDIFKIDGTLTYRTPEFKTQAGGDHYGTISVSFRF